MHPLELRGRGEFNKNFKREEDEIIEQELDSFELGKNIPPELRDRLLMLNMRQMSLGETQIEIETTLKHTINVNEIIKEVVKDIPLLEDIKEELKLGALLHDVGKTGPINNEEIADQRKLELQRLHMRLFSLTESNDSEILKDQTIEEVVEDHANEKDAEKILNNLDLLGFKPDQKMSEVYRKHLKSTREILEHYKINKEVAWIAGHHHSYLELDDNGDHKEFTQKKKDKLKLASLVLEIVDSFEAVKARAGLPNEKNIEKLKSRFHNNPQAQNIINLLEKKQEVIDRLFVFKLESTI